MTLSFFQNSTLLSVWHIAFNAFEQDRETVTLPGGTAISRENQSHKKNDSIAAMSTCSSKTLASSSKGSCTSLPAIGT